MNQTKPHRSFDGGNPMQRVQLCSSEVSRSARKPSGGFLCMWHGLSIRGVLRILKHRPSFSWFYLPRWLSIFGFSIFNTVANTAETVVHSRRIRKTVIEHDPVFILGHWRSGTTLLHNLLALDQSLTFPNFYQCMCSGHFLLTERLITSSTNWLLPATRPMDNIALGWKVPMEDEMAIAVSCGVSPYLMAAFPGRSDIYERFFDFDGVTQAERLLWRETFLTLMKKLTIRQNRRIVLKSPTHTFRIPALLEMFPDARFAYIFRNPYEVFQSTLHLHRTMFVENSLEPPHLDSAPEEALARFDKCIRMYEQTKKLIPPGNLHEVRFEDLEDDPLETMRNVYLSLRLSDRERARDGLESELPRLRSYRKNRFSIDPETKRLVYERLRWIFNLYGYPQ